MMAYSALRQLERWAFVRDRLPHPIMMRVEVGGHEPWSDAHVAVAEQHVSPVIVRFITLGANTGQRVSDLIKMKWDAIEIIDGHTGINVTQKKTGKKLWIPFTKPLIEAFDGWDRRGPFLVPPRLFEPWNRGKLAKHWARERKRNPNLAAHKELGLVLHGLRATACVRLSRAGATTRQIADMVGMSEGIVARYLRLSAQRENALAAIVHLDRYLDRNRVKGSESGS